MFYTYVNQHYNIWFCKVEMSQTIYRCNILVTHREFNNSQATFQAVQG